MSTDLYSTRRRNLRALIDQWDGPVKLARHLGHSSASFLSQLTGPRHNREITEKVARAIERKTGLPTGWLDQAEHTPPPPVDETKLLRVVRLVGQALEDANVNVNPRKFAELVALLYEHGEDEMFLRRMIDLTK